MTPKHTPGPWRVSESMSQDLCIYKDALYLATISGACSKSPANARLIAAAPLGLELAYKVRDSVSCGGCRSGNLSLESSCCIARRLIAATEGRDAD